SGKTRGRARPRTSWLRRPPPMRRAPLGAHTFSVRWVRCARSIGRSPVGFSPDGTAAFGPNLHHAVAVGVPRLLELILHLERDGEHVRLALEVDRRRTRPLRIILRHVEESGRGFQTIVGYLCISKRLFGDFACLKTGSLRQVP